MGGEKRSGPPVARTQGLEGALTSDPVEQALARIRHVTRSMSLQVALEIGEIVFELIFGGDARLMRERGPKEISFRRLALHPDLPVSASTLWRSVGIYELSRRMPQLARSEHLGASHVRAVLGLPQREQEQLLRRAETERWELSRLESHAATRRRGRGGRPPKLEILKALDTLRRVAAIPVSTFGDRAAVKRMTSEDIDVALATLNELDARLRELQKVLLAEVDRD